MSISKSVEHNTIGINTTNYQKCFYTVSFILNSKIAIINFSISNIATNTESNNSNDDIIHIKIHASFFNISNENRGIVINCYKTFPYFLV